MLKQAFKIAIFYLILLFSIGTFVARGAEMAISEEEVANKMKLAIRHYLSTRFQKDPIRINVKGITPILTGKILSPMDTVEVTQGPEGEGTRGFVGRKLFLISVKQDGGRAGDYWVTADVSFARKIIVAGRPIKRKERIDTESLTVLTVDQVRPEELYVETPEALFGKQATRSILPGVPITLDMVEDAPVMSRGDRVTLFVETEGVTISVSGQTKEEGFLGRQVAVVPLDGQKTIYGTVVSRSRVKVAF
jgi:flagella basal body P-ring formation protein FlgA